MSSASKCDKCGKLYEPRKGCVSLEVSIHDGSKEGTSDTWSDVDFCEECSKPVREAIGSAIED